MFTVCLNICKMIVEKKTFINLFCQHSLMLCNCFSVFRRAGLKERSYLRQHGECVWYGPDQRREPYSAEPG